MKAKFVNENINNILKPKRQQEVLDAYIQMTVSQQWEAICENGMNFIPIERWPVIMQIKTSLRKNMDFENRFRVSATDEIFNTNGRVIGITFRIENRDDNDLGYVALGEFNHAPGTVEIMTENGNNVDYVHGYNGFVKWFNDYFLYPNGMSIIKESIESVLKPKSEEDIEKQLNEMPIEDLVDSWRDTYNILFFKQLVKRAPKFITENDILEAYSIDENIVDSIIPLILKNYPYDIVQDGDKFKLSIGWWDDLMFMFEDGNVSIENIEKILSGDSYDLFEFDTDERYFQDIFSNTAGAIQRMKVPNNFFNDILERIKYKLKANANANIDTRDIDKIQSLESFFSLISNNIESIDYTFLSALVTAIDRVQTVANEAEAVEDIMNEIYKRLKITKEDFTYNEQSEQYELTLSKDAMLDVFLMYHNAHNKIYIYEPRNGWNGDIDDFPQELKEALSEI